MGNDSFFEGLDDAEDVPASPDVTETPPAEAPAPEASAKPDDKPVETTPEKGEKSDATKSAEKSQEKAPEVTAEKPAEKVPHSEITPTQPDPRKWVPVGAHVELRNKLKALEDKLLALENPPKPKAEPPAPPDFTQDPKAYVDHKVQAALEQLETGLKPVKETAEQANAQSAETRFFTHLQTAEQTFAAQNPDYYAALEHLREIRRNEIRLLDPDVTHEQLQQIVNREELNLAANILRSGRNPSEVAYNLAKARGYSKPKSPEPLKPEEKKPELKLPDVPEPKKLPPDLTLGTGTGSPITEDANEDPFEAAQREWMDEIFGKRKRA